MHLLLFAFFFQAEDGIRDHCVTGVQTCALPIFASVATGKDAPRCPTASSAGARPQVWRRRFTRRIGASRGEGGLLPSRSPPPRRPRKSSRRRRGGSDAAADSGIRERADRGRTPPCAGRLGRSR